MLVCAMFAWLKSNCMLKRLFPFNIIAFPSPLTCGNQNPRRLSLFRTWPPLSSPTMCSFPFTQQKQQSKILVQIPNTMTLALFCRSARLKWQPRKCLCFHVCASLKHSQKHELSLSSSRLSEKLTFPGSAWVQLSNLSCVFALSFLLLPLLSSLVRCLHTPHIHSLHKSDCLACNKNVFGGMAHRVKHGKKKL